MKKKIILITGIVVLLLLISFCLVKRWTIIKIRNRELCLAHLFFLDKDKEQYALTYNKTNGWSWPDDLTAFSELLAANSAIKSFPLCPAFAGPLSLNRLSNAAACYSVNKIGELPFCKIHLHNWRTPYKFEELYPNPLWSWLGARSWEHLVSNIKMEVSKSKQQRIHEREWYKKRKKESKQRIERKIEKGSAGVSPSVAVEKRLILTFVF